MAADGRVAEDGTAADGMAAMIGTITQA